MDGATKSFQQAYNAQAAVDSHWQVIVAAAITQEANDKKQLVPMLEQTEQNVGKKPEHATADAGYFSEAALSDPKVAGIDMLVAPDRQKHGRLNEKTGQVIHDAAKAEIQESQPEGVSGQGTAFAQQSVAEQMREKLRSTAGKAIYKMRKAVVEPVFGQIKERRKLRGFLFRGLEKVKAEWQIICLTHNLLKLYLAGKRAQEV